MAAREHDGEGNRRGYADTDAGPSGWAEVAKEALGPGRPCGPESCVYWTSRTWGAAEGGSLPAVHKRYTFDDSPVWRL